MKTAIISLPLANVQADEIERILEGAKKELKRMGYKLVDSIFTEPTEPVKNIAMYYQSKQCELMANIDLVIFAGAWQQARGCQAMYYLCQAYGVESTVYYESVEV